MSRAGIGLLLVGALLLLVMLLLAVVAGIVAMPSYLATWLFWTSLPIGALPVVMMLDLVGPPTGSIMELALRRLVLLTPLALLLALPVLVWPDTLFGWATGHSFTTPFGQAWMTRGAFIARSVGYLIFWLLLALIFSQRPGCYRIGTRRGVAAIALFLYALTATLASVDWAMTVAPDWFSGGFGLLFIASQVTVAISVAVLLAGGAWRRAAPEAAAGFLLLAVGVWVFLQFTQFLVIWSGNKPTDITWYLDRANLASRIAVWIALVAGVAAPMLLLDARLRRWTPALPALAVLTLCAQALAMLWLVTPSLRHHFIVSGMDALGFVGIGGVMLGAILWPGPVRDPQWGAVRHD